MNTNLNPWDQQPGESDAEYEEFTTWLNNYQYQDGHHKRNMRHTPSTTSYNYRRKLANRHSWSQRAIAYDNHHRDQQQRERLEHQRHIYDQHLTVTRQLAQLALHTIDTINPNDLDDKTKIGILKTLNEYVTAINNYTTTTTTTTTTTATLTDTATLTTNPTRTLEHVITEIQQRKNT